MNVKKMGLILFFMIFPFCSFAAENCNEQGALDVSSCSSMLCVAAGYTRYAHPQNFCANTPFLVQSKDKGITWQPISFIENLPQPDGAIRDISCSGKLCVGIGVYNIYGNSPSEPFLVQTRDGGDTWQTILFPNILTFSFFESVSCSIDICVAAGKTFLDDGSIRLFIVQSTDGGLTWKNFKDVYNLPTDIGVAKVSCVDFLCTIAGMKALKKEYVPLLLKTNDGGNTWNEISNIGDMPALQSGTFFDISCTGNLCVAVGRYKAKNSQTDTALIIQSTDKGMTWNVVKQHYGNFPWTGSFTNVSCSGKTCIAGGQGYTDHKNVIPIMIQTVNSASSWEPQHLPNLPNGFIRSTICTKESCIVSGGNYSIPGTTLPFIANKMPLPSSWKVASTLFDSNPAGGIGEVACYLKFCIAASRYNGSPLILQSNDGGTTWSNVTLY
jgi:photosystem II stability/assembly factor-like uncharacterized protein